MAAPVADKIQLPLDTGNTGKKVRTQTRVVGADTVHEHFYIPTSERSITGAGKANCGVQTVPTAAHNGTSTGFWWLWAPTGGKNIALRRLYTSVKFNALAVDLLPGELRVSRFTFSGTPSGAVITPAKRKTADTLTAELRTASTGLTVTLVATAYSKLFPTMDLVTGGAGQWNPMEDWWDADEEQEQIVLVPGEGLVCWSAAALTTANRRMVNNVAWEEFE